VVRAVSGVSVVYDRSSSAVGAVSLCRVCPSCLW
jgi:hypothetical protein